MTLLLAAPAEEDELELIDDSNVIELSSRRVKVQVEEELEVVEDEADILASLDQTSQEILSRAKRTVEKMKKAKLPLSFEEQLLDWKLRQQQ